MLPRKAAKLGLGPVLELPRDRLQRGLAAAPSRTCPSWGQVGAGALPSAGFGSGRAYLLLACACSAEPRASDAGALPRGLGKDGTAALALSGNARPAPLQTLAA